MRRGGARGDGEGVERSLDDEDLRVGGEVVVARPVEDLGLVEDGRAGGVAVLRRGGVAADVASDEAVDRAALAGDREDEAVAVGVDEPAAAGAHGQVHGDELVVLDPAPAEVVGQGGPSVGGVTDEALGREVARQGGEVDAASVLQVVAGEADADGSGEVVPGELVDGEGAAGRDVRRRWRRRRGAAAAEGRPAGAGRGTARRRVPLRR